MILNIILNKHVNIFMLYQLNIPISSIITLFYKTIIILFIHMTKEYHQPLIVMH